MEQGRGIIRNQRNLQKQKDPIQEICPSSEATCNQGAEIDNKKKEKGVGEFNLRITEKPTSLEKQTVFGHIHKLLYFPKYKQHSSKHKNSSTCLQEQQNPYIYYNGAFDLYFLIKRQSSLKSKNIFQRQENILKTSYQQSRFITYQKRLRTNPK